MTVWFSVEQETAFSYYIGKCNGLVILKETS
jgi:hypothetical protein